MVLTPITKITRPEDIVEYLAEFIADSSIPLAYVAKYDEPLNTEYPAVLVQSGPFNKAYHGTHTWRLTLKADIYVMHAKLTATRAARNYEDLLLATQIVTYLETDMKLGGRVIQSWIENEIPGAMPPFTQKGAAVVSTRLQWSGLAETRF